MVSVSKKYPSIQVSQSVALDKQAVQFSWQITHVVPDKKNPSRQFKQVVVVPAQVKQGSTHSIHIYPSSDNSSLQIQLGAGYLLAVS